MGTHPTRQMVSLDEDIFRWLKLAAKKSNLSVSHMIRNHLKEAYDLREEKYWADEGEKRLKSFDSKKSVTHLDAWK